MKRWAWVPAVVLLMTVVGVAGAGAQEKAATEAATPDAVAEAEGLLAAGDSDGAAKVLEKGMDTIGTGGGAAALRLGVLRVSRGELDTAIDAYTAAAERLEGPAKGEALGRMAVVQDTRGMAEAAASAEAAVAADPDGVWPTIAMSFRRVDEGQADEAVSLARKAVDAGGGAPAQGALGHALQAQGDVAGAETAYRAAMAADESLMGPVIGLASVLRSSNRAAEAEPLLTRVLEASPGAVEAYKEMARVKIALNRADGKRPWTKSVPIHVRAMVLTGKTLFTAGPLAAEADRPEGPPKDPQVLLIALSAADGKELARLPLPAEPPEPASPPTPPAPPSPPAPLMPPSPPEPALPPEPAVPPAPPTPVSEPHAITSSAVVKVSVRIRNSPPALVTRVGSESRQYGTKR